MLPMPGLAVDAVFKAKAPGVVHQPAVHQRVAIAPLRAARGDVYSQAILMVTGSWAGYPIRIGVIFPFIYLFIEFSKARL